MTFLIFPIGYIVLFVTVYLYGLSQSSGYERNPRATKKPQPKKEGAKPENCHEKSKTKPVYSVTWDVKTGKVLEELTE